MSFPPPPPPPYPYTMDELKSIISNFDRVVIPNPMYRDLLSALTNNEVALNSIYNFYFVYSGLCRVNLSREGATFGLVGDYMTEITVIDDGGNATVNTTNRSQVDTYETNANGRLHANMNGDFAYLTSYGATDVYVNGNNDVVRIQQAGSTATLAKNKRNATFIANAPDVVIHVSFMCQASVYESVATATVTANLDGENSSLSTYGPGAAWVNVNGSNNNVILNWPRANVLVTAYKFNALIVDNGGDAAISFASNSQGVVKENTVGTSINTNFVGSNAAVDVYAASVVMSAAYGSQNNKITLHQAGGIVKYSGGFSGFPDGNFISDPVGRSTVNVASGSVIVNGAHEKINLNSAKSSVTFFGSAGLISYNAAPPSFSNAWVSHVSGMGNTIDATAAGVGYLVVNGGKPQPGISRYTVNGDATVAIYISVPDGRKILSVNVVASSSTPDSDSARQLVQAMAGTVVPGSAMGGLTDFSKPLSEAPLVAAYH